MKGTRLWKPAGSPLIQGRSRRERPFAADWLSGSVLGWIAGCAVVISVAVARGATFTTVLQTVWPPALAATAVGAALGVSLSRHFGWHPRWIAATIVGALTVVAVVTIWSAVAPLGG